MKEEAAETVGYREGNQLRHVRSETSIAVRRRLRHVQLGRAPGLGVAHHQRMLCTHIAIQESLDGKNVEWMEHVTDAQYVAGVSAG